MTLPAFVASLSANYVAILHNVPRVDPARRPHSAQDIAADGAWEAERARDARVDAPARYLGFAAGVAGSVLAALAWWFFGR